MTTVEMNAELLMQLSHIAGNESYMKQTLEFLRTLTGTARHEAQSRGLPYQQMLRRLSDFQEYERGWDDADALPLSRDVVKNFKELLEQTTDSQLEGWTIFPAANGTLLLEYQPLEAGINIGRNDFSYYLMTNGMVSGKDNQKYSPKAVLKTMQHISHAK